jgi:hypothetical protein
MNEPPFDYLRYKLDEPLDEPRPCPLCDEPTSGWASKDGESFNALCPTCYDEVDEAWWRHETEPGEKILRNWHGNEVAIEAPGDRLSREDWRITFNGSERVGHALPTFAGAETFAQEWCAQHPR